MKNTQFKTDFYNINEDLNNKCEQYFAAPAILFLDESFISLSDTAKMLYIRMLGRTSLSKKNGWCDECGNIYIIFTIEEMKKLHDCSGYKIQKSLKELENFELIERRKSSTGQVNKIYVKHIISEQDNTHNGFTPKQMEENDNSLGIKEAGDVSSVPLSVFPHVPNNNICDNCKETLNNNVEVDFQHNMLKTQSQKTTPSYSYKSNIDYNVSYHYPSYYSTSEQKQNVKGERPLDDLNSGSTSAYERVIKHNIAYDDNMQILPVDEKEWYQAMYECIYDIVCVPREKVRVSRIDYPYQVVKSKFLKLKQSNLKYAISCIKKHAKNIKNVKSYIITTLYNSFTANAYYQNHYQQMVENGCFA